MRKPLSSPAAMAAGPYSQGLDADSVVVLSGRIPAEVELVARRSA